MVCALRNDKAEIVFSATGVLLELFMKNLMKLGVYPE